MMHDFHFSGKYESFHESNGADPTNLWTTTASTGKGYWAVSRQQ